MKNPFARFSKRLLPERVSLPGVSREAVEALQQELDFQVRQRRGYVVAMLQKGKAFANKPVPARRLKVKTAHVQRIESARVRSAFLRSDA